MAAKQSSLLTKYFPDLVHRVVLGLFLAMTLAVLYFLPILRWSAMNLYGLMFDTRKYGFSQDYLQGLKGINLIRRGNLSQAEPFLKRSVAIEPNSAFLGELAALYLRQGHLAKARLACEQYMRRFPDDGRGYLLFAEIGLKRGIEVALIEKKLTEGIQRVARAYREKRGIPVPAPQPYLIKNLELERELGRQLKQMRQTLARLRKLPAEAPTP